MKRRYTAAFIAVMIAGGLFAGCGSAARDNVASKEKDINKEQVATKAIAYEETFEKVTQKTDSENNKQTESNQQDANASDSSDNQTDAGQADIGTDNVQENSQNSGYQDDASQDDSYQDNGSGYGSESDDNGGSSDAGENSDDSSSGESANVIDDESLLAIAKINTVTYSEFANRVLELVNNERANAGVAPLVLDEALCNAANMRAIEMDCTGVFGHKRPNDHSCFEVYDICNVEWQNACGENIAAGQATPEDVMKSWLSSAGHKANILSPEYTKMGLGYSNSGCGAGRYSHYWAQEFAG
ncbi:CAP domain-containing protein [Eubacterium sp. AM46-8]|uniref:CAP domain-containing protein n=1 Tax=Eubacterium sp. AM46-8 TaxID=2292350 RepID=UPI000E4D8591|nr:CAP domain-containing protein [Eubacterium sp. AM46-8]RGZ88820.1 hypothetical protein DW963_11995 [Eubacterium sp. AM46-8]